MTPVLPHREGVRIAVARRRWACGRPGVRAPQPMKRVTSAAGFLCQSGGSSAGPESKVAEGTWSQITPGEYRNAAPSALVVLPRTRR